MSIPADQKVTANHLQRDAYLYVRQSTIRQVFENTESTKRQYGLRQKAIALGWPTEKVIVIDSDLGMSGASAADREGFQRLVTEVGLGRAGIVLGLEVSRLARNSTDWHRLLEICALTDTLILDEDGLYDPTHFNDRLLLGLKGTMSEAELHVLRARLRGGIENKARRGELRAPLPIGFVYDDEDRVVFEPDRQVQDTLGKFFQTFEETGSAMATVKHFRTQGWKFPRKLRRGIRKGEIVWGECAVLASCTTKTGNLKWHPSPPTKTARVVSCLLPPTVDAKRSGLAKYPSGSPRASNSALSTWLSPQRRAPRSTPIPHAG